MNPRRAPRAPARCRAAVVSPHGRFEGDTEDIGSLGCQVVSPQLVRKGDAVQLLITNEKLEEPLQAAGRVAWVSARPPWRAGIAFDDRCLAASARWFDRLISVYPGLSGYRRVPDRIPTDQAVYLGAPPRFLLDFTADEAVLLRAIASGARIDELMARLRDGWPAAQRALFSLIARGAVTLQRGQAVHPDTWKKILSDVEASLAVESLGKEGVAAPLAPERPAPTPPIMSRPSATPPPVARPAATPPPTSTPARAATPVPGPRSGLSHGTSWKGGEPYDPTRVVELQDEGPPLDVAATPGGPASRKAPSGPAVARDFTGAGVGWRKPAKRSADAQVAYERALSELEAGNVNGAVTFLRIALTLAPGDPEIAQQLGKIAFRGRLPDGG